MVLLYIFAQNYNIQAGPAALRTFKAAKRATASGLNKAAESVGQSQVAARRPKNGLPSGKLT